MPTGVDAEGEQHVLLGVSRRSTTRSGRLGDLGGAEGVLDGDGGEPAIDDGVVVSIVVAAARGEEEGLDECC